MDTLRYHDPATVPESERHPRDDLAYAVPLTHFLSWGLTLVFDLVDGGGYSFSLLDREGNPVAKGLASPDWKDGDHPSPVYRLAVEWIDSHRWRLMSLGDTPGETTK